MFILSNQRISFFVIYVFCTFLFPLFSLLVKCMNDQSRSEFFLREYIKKQEILKWQEEGKKKKNRDICNVELVKWPLIKRGQALSRYGPVY